MTVKKHALEIGEATKETESNSLHFINATVATEFGPAHGILFQDIDYWVRKNEKKGVNQVDGRTWMYRTQTEFHKQYPYLSVRKISNAIKELEAAELIESSCLNQKGYDRTRWYTLGKRAALYQVDYQPVKTDSSNPQKSTVASVENQQFQPAETAPPIQEKKKNINRRESGTDKPSSSSRFVPSSVERRERGKPCVSMQSVPKGFELVDDGKGGTQWVKRQTIH